MTWPCAFADLPDSATDSPTGWAPFDLKAKEAWTPLQESEEEDAAQRAADKVREWVNRRIDEGALDIARIYRSSRDDLVKKIGHIYENFLKDEPTIVKARQVGAISAIDRIVQEHVDSLVTELGDKSVSLIGSMADAHPTVVNKWIAPLFDFEATAIPKPYETVLAELTTAIVGGGTYHDRLLNIGQGMKDDIYGSIRQSLISGSDFKTLSGKLMDIFGVDKLDKPRSNAYGSVNIFKNEARRQWNDLMSDMAEEKGKKEVWYAELDEDTTPGCAARHGIPLDELDEDPPRHYNCTVGETEVEGQFVTAMRMLYAGKVRKIVTASGKALTVTPEHPVLTLRGMVPACRLKEGDYLLSYSGKGEPNLTGTGVSSPDDDKNRPPAIKDVFEALKAAGASATVARSGLEFHGDAVFGESNIDVVTVDRELLDYWAKVEALKEGSEIIFEPPHSASSMSEVGHPSSSKFGLVGVRVLDSSSPVRWVDRGNVPFEAPTKACAVGFTSQLDTVTLEVVSQTRVRDAKFARQLRNRLSSFVTLDPVVNINDDSFSGHVYDLQAVSGVIVANGFIISNCRCEILVVETDADTRDLQAEADAWLEAHGWTRDEAYMEESWQPLGEVGSSTGAKKGWVTRRGGIPAKDVPEEYKQAAEWIKQAGATFNGLQEFPGQLPYLTFTDHATGSTLMLRVDLATQQGIQDKVDAKRAEFAKYKRESARPYWGKHKLILMADEMDYNEADHLYGYGSVKLRKLPEVATWGGALKWAQSIKTARKYAEPDSVPVRAPMRFLTSKSFVSQKHIEVLTEVGWEPIKGKGAWIEVSPGTWALDGPSRAAWTTKFFKPSRAVLARYPALEGLRVRAVSRTVYRGAVVDSECARFHALLAATENDSSNTPVAWQEDKHFPSLIDRLLLKGERPGSHLLVWQVPAGQQTHPLVSQLQVVAEIESGKVIYARDHFPPGLEPVRYRMAVLCSEGGRVWAVRPKDSNSWYLPGGHKEAGESRGATAVREMMEETGLRVELEGVEGQIHRPQFTTVVFRGRVIGRREPSAVDEVEEVALVELERLDVSERFWVEVHL